MPLDETVGDLSNDANDNDESGRTDPLGLGLPVIGYGSIRGDTPSLFTTNNLFTNDSSPGADEGFTSIYALVIGGSPNSDSKEAQSDQDIVLEAGLDGSIIGRFAPGNAGIAFVVTINASTGEIRIHQYRAMEHNDGNDHEEPGLSAATMPADRLLIQATITDKDGDTDTDTVDLGSRVRFEDDVQLPVGSAATVTANETGPLASLAGAINIGGGSDKAADLAFGLDGNGNPLHPAGLTSDGIALSYALRTSEVGEEQLVAYKANQTIDQPVFIVALSSPANPTYIFTLFQNLDHATGSDLMALGFTIRATDGDGDWVDRTISVNVEDSKVSAPDSAAVTPASTVSETGTTTLTGVPLGITWGADDDNVSDANFPSIDRAIAFTNVTASGNVTATDASGCSVSLTSNGDTVLFALMGGVLVGFTDPAAAGPLAGLDDSRIVFTATLSDTGTGAYSFDLRQPLDHAGPSPVGGHYIDLAFAYTATDADGDPDPGHFTVRVDAAGVNSASTRAMPTSRPA